MRRSILLILLLSVCFHYGYSQMRRISGTVMDEEGKPLSNVTVKPDDGLAPALTNTKGGFSVAITEKTTRLIFSSVSYVTQTVPIKDSTRVNIVLKQDVIGLEEVVAIGYGTQKKANLTGAVSTVTVDEAEGRALTSIEQLLQGKVSGVGIVQNSGRPGDDMGEIRIRGISSIDNNNEPLVIIDGVQADLNDVNPQDVESISILKDAASAAIYGSRASAGVILIETKKGKDTGGTLKLDYNGTFSLSNATRLPDVVNSWEHFIYKNEARKNVGQPEAVPQDRIEDYRRQDDPRYPNTDWYDVYFRQSHMQNHYVGLRGRSKNSGFSSSVSYKDQEGVLIGTAANRISYNSSLWGNFFKNKVNVSVGVNGYREGVDELTESTNAIMGQIAQMTPSSFIRSTDPETGMPNLYGYHGRFLAGEELGGGINAKNTQLNTRASVEIIPVKNLKGKIMLANNKYNQTYTIFRPEFYTAADFMETGTQKRESLLEKRFGRRDQNTYLFSLDYKLSKGRHDMNFFAAHEKLETIYNRDDGQVKEMSSNAPIFNFGDPNQLYLNSEAYEYATSSYFGRFNYAYANKYLFEFNFRRDGSSRFAPAHRWGSFPSVSAAWRVSQENFMQGLDFMDLKLRGSWGRLGNQNIWGQYYAFADVMSGQEYYAFGNIIVPGRGTNLLANKSVRWETTEQTNIGLDLILWNRLSLEAELFHKNTFDILARVTVPPSLGISTLPYQNIGAMTNRGIELNLSYRSPRRADKINYTLATNFTYIKNKLTTLGGLPFVDHTGNTRSVVGEPFSSYYGYQVDRIYQVSDFTWQHDSDPAIPHDERVYVLKNGLPNQSNLMDTPAPGDVKLVDADGNGQVTPDDRTLIGNPLPKFQYGFNADLSYKQFSLNIIGHGVQGSDGYMNGHLIAPFFNTQGTITRTMVDNRWTYDNPSDRYTRLYEDKTRDGLVTDYHIYDASFFRLKSIQLGYELPKKFVQRYQVDRCRAFFNAENLLLLTSFIEGFDPERSYKHVTASFHPQIASYTLGLNLNF